MNTVQRLSATHTGAQPVTRMQYITSHATLTSSCCTRVRMLGLGYGAYLAVWMAVCQLLTGETITTRRKCVLPDVDVGRASQPPRVKYE